MLFPGLCAVVFPGRTVLAGWEERFAQPPAEARILKIIHNWPDQAGAQDQLIGRLRTQGFGGVVCNVSFEQYLESEAKWLVFVRAVNEAKKAGLALWLYDERGYPPATPAASRYVSTRSGKHAACSSPARNRRAVP
jgi:hypothetical protein